MILKEQTIERWIQRAREICDSGHDGQTRHDGSPYKYHPHRVAAAVEDRLKPIAYLHDIVEDTPITLEDLRREGFPQYIISAISALTHKPGESNIEYWGKIKLNPDSLEVKLKDISDNLNDQPSASAREKYTRALAFFGVTL